MYPFPSWALWASSVEYLPEECHNKRGFNKQLKLIQDIGEKSSQRYPSFALAYGLLLHEIDAVQFSVIDPDGPPPPGPHWFVKSAMEILWKPDVYKSMETTL